MKKVLLVIGLVLYTLASQASIQVQIEPSPVSVNETFQLTLTQEGSQGGGVPNLKILQKDFLILSTARQVSYALVNGQSTTSNQWIISLKPLRTGVLSIPAIKIGSEQSDPMTINVEANGSSVQEEDQIQNNAGTSNQSIILKTSMDSQAPYVNQEIIYTVKLYNSKRLLNAEYQAPQAEDALIIPLGDAKRYQETLGGTQYVVEEQQYAVFPQKSGVLKIISPMFTALVYDFNPQRVKVQDKESDVVVQPIPKNYQNTQWLPAKAVHLTEHYENESQHLGQGSTLVRSITLEGVGTTAQLLPNLTFKGTDEFNVYPEKGTDRNQVRQGELVGSTEFKVTYLFNKAGTIVLPEVRVPWFNTKTGKKETAVLAPRSIDIAPSSTTQKPQINLKPNQITQPIKHQTLSENLSNVTKNTSSYWPWIVAGFFACAWVFTLMLWGWQKCTKSRSARSNRAALAKLKKACKGSDPKASRDALLQWATVNWPDTKLINLHDLTVIVGDTALKKQIHTLSQILYKEDSTTLWRGDALYRAVEAINKRTPRIKKNKDNPLPPINPF